MPARLLLLASSIIHHHPAVRLLNPAQPSPLHIFPTSPLFDFFAFFHIRELQYFVYGQVATIIPRILDCILLSNSRISNKLNAHPHLVAPPCD